MRLNEVEIPPMPKMILQPPQVTYYKHPCAKCGKELESSVKTATIIQCRSCWKNKPTKVPQFAVQYSFKGLRAKKFLP